jgi:hypothetical protein
MAGIPRWRLTGDWFDVCSCSIPCPCTFAQAPTGGECDGVLAWHIRQGSYGDVTLDGLTVVAVSNFRGNVWAGDTKAVMGTYFDERADERQRAALQSIFGGEAGGWPGGFAELIGEMRGVEFVGIDFHVDGDLAHWRVEVPGRVVAEAEALTGPTTPPGARVQVINAPGAEVGPGQVATWGRGTKARVNAFGFDMSFEGSSSKHFPFDWSGPDVS